MPRPKLMLFLFCVTFAIAFTPFTAVALDAPEVFVSANARGNYGVPDNVVESTETTGNVSAHSEQPSYIVVDYADAEAKFGNLYGRVKAVDNDGYYYASGATVSRWRDIVTINAPGKKGQVGYATLSFKVTGKASFQTNDSNCLADVSASATVYNGATWEIRPSKRILPDGTFLGDDFLGVVQNLNFTFTYGEPFQLTVILNTSGSTSGSSGGTGVTIINAELFWLGFSNIRASDNLTLVAEPAVSSQSESNYAHPIGMTYPKVTLQATPIQITENPEQISTIKVKLDKPAPARIRVDLAYTGTAIRGKDYVASRPSYIYVSKGSTSTTFTIRSRNDPQVEGAEKVLIHVLPGIGFARGIPHTANVTIESED